MRRIPIRAALALLLAGACSHAAPMPTVTATPTPSTPAAGAREGAPAAERPEGGAPETPAAGRGGGRGGQGGGNAANSEPTLQPYARVVTSDAETRTGLFKTHRIGSRLLFEIPRDQLGRDQLVVMEIAKTVLGSGYGGQAAGNRVLR